MQSLQEVKQLCYTNSYISSAWVRLVTVQISRIKWPNFTKVMTKGLKWIVKYPRTIERTWFYSLQKFPLHAYTNMKTNWLEGSPCDSVWERQTFQANSPVGIPNSLLPLPKPLTTSPRQKYGGNLVTMSEGISKYKADFCRARVWSDRCSFHGREKPQTRKQYYATHAVTVRDAYK